MSLVHLALNPNITSEQFSELAVMRLESQKRIQEIFLHNLDKIESPEQKANYISLSMPILMAAMF